MLLSTLWLHCTICLLLSVFKPGIKLQMMNFSLWFVLNSINTSAVLLNEIKYSFLHVQCVKVFMLPVFGGNGISFVLCRFIALFRKTLLCCSQAGSDKFWAGSSQNNRIRTSLVKKTSPLVKIPGLNTYLSWCLFYRFSISEFPKSACHHWLILVVIHGDVDQSLIANRIKNSTHMTR